MRWLLLVSVLLLTTACGSVGTLGGYGDPDAQPGVCGNDVAEDEEECDGDDLAGKTCQSLGYIGGTVSCDIECQVNDSRCEAEATVPERWTCPDELYGGGGGCDCGCGALDPDCGTQMASECDTCDSPGSCGDGACPGNIDPSNNALCAQVTSVCNNGVREVGELCDGFDVGSETCETQGFDAGTLSCTTTCDAYDTGGCTTGGTVPTSWTCYTGYYGAGDGCDCGCGAVDPDCGGSTAGLCDYCSNSGACSSSCSDIDPVDNSTCGGGGGVTCNNNVVEGGEVCDGFDLAGNDCTTIGLGYTGGTLECNSTCSGWDTTSCTTGGGTPVPGTWVCNSAWWSDGLCDCGCGAFDVDDCAAQDDIDECDYCTDTGSCASSCADIDPTDISTCIVSTGGGTPAAPGDVILSEMMPNPSVLNDSAGEWFELHNPTANDWDLTDCEFRSDPSNLISAGGQQLPAGGYLVYAASSSPGFTPNHTYSQGTFSLRNGDDTWELWCDAGSGDVQIDAVTYDDTAGWTVPNGSSMQLDSGSLTHTANDSAASWCNGTNSYNGDNGTPGSANNPCP